jgi:hypothetical protein
MSDEPELTAARLRIVTNNGEAVPPKRSATPVKARRRFAQVGLDRLRDPVWQREAPARLRLYLLLQYLTKRGARSWTLTNDEAAAVGVVRQHKHRCLRELEARGLIRVIRKGGRNPEVALVPPGLL